MGCTGSAEAQDQTNNSNKQLTSSKIKSHPIASLPKISQKSKKQSQNIQKHDLSSTKVLQIDYQNQFISIIDQIMKKQLKIKSNLKYNMEFRASVNGFSSQKFHQVCDQLENSLILIRSADKKVFGGFTPCKWKKGKSYFYMQDQKALSFLFLLKLDANTNSSSKMYKIFSIDQNKKNSAIMNDDQCGPVFGQGHDLQIKDKCNKIQNWANLGQTYKLPQGIKFGSNKANQMLNGSLTFLVDEYQVWSIKFQN